MDSLAVGLYDPDPRKRLVGFLSDSRITTTCYTQLDDLNASLRAGAHHVSVVALETMGADARKRLEELRTGSPYSKVVLVHEESTPRARFAQRLWMVGACDAVVSRAQPSKLQEVIQRFHLEARLEQRHREALGDDDDPSEAFARFRATQNLFSALAGQETTDGILRELSRGFRDLIDFEVLGVLTVQDGGPKLYIFQSGPVAHQILVEIADVSCAAANQLQSTLGLKADAIEYVQPTLLPNNDSPPRSSTSDAPKIEVCPLIAGARVVGCITVRAGAWGKEEVYALFAVASHVAVALDRARMLETARRLSDTDPLTGVHNRRFLDKILESEWSRARRYSLQLSVVIVDVDHFAEINELRGRSVGDMALIHLAEGLKGLIRSADHVLRIGGDQFLLLLPETGAVGAERLIERARVLLKTNPIQAEEGMFSLSVSCGVASHPTIDADTPHQLVSKAQEALSRAKAAGKNRTVHAGASVGLDTGSSEHRREPRMALELPVTFIPLPELDSRSALRLSSVNISSSGLALRDRARLLKRNSHGLVFFDDRPNPLLCRVAWSKAIESEYHAGLICLKSGDFHESAHTRRWEKRKAVVITNDPDYLAVAKRVLRTTKHAVHVVDPDQKIPDDVLAGCSLIVVGDRALQGDVGARLLEMRREATEPFRIIVLNEDLDRERAIEMISSRHVEHLISGRANPTESLFATLTKLLRQEFFGVHRYLLAGADIKSWSVSQPAEKSFVLAGVRAVADEVDCHPRVTDLLISAVDEMLINALYRPAQLTFQSDLPVTVECGADGRLLCVGVLDDHGVLEVDHIYSGLEAAARAQREGFAEDATSAHLGFRIMLSALSQLAINVEPGHRTEIIGIVDLRKSLRDHRASAPSLGIFKK